MLLWKKQQHTIFFSFPGMVVGAFFYKARATGADGKGFGGTGRGSIRFFTFRTGFFPVYMAMICSKTLATAAQ